MNRRKSRRRPVRATPPDTAAVALEAVAASKPAVRGTVTEAEARYRRPAYGVLCVLLLFVTLGALGHVAIHLKHIEVALALGEARRTRSELLEKKRKLELEIGVLEDPGRILDIAREKLGMRPPDLSDIVPVEALAGRLARATEPPGADEAPEGWSEEGPDDEVSRRRLRRLRRLRRAERRGMP